MTATRNRRILCAFLLAANLAFIWGNSLLDGSQSGHLSGSILTWVNSFLGLDEAGAEFMHHLIRKAAHFTEFACLGMLLTWGCGMAGLIGVSLFTLPLFGSLTAACIDETIQIYVAGRGSSLLDVWTDAAGALTGMMLLLLGHHLWKKYKR